MRKHIIIILTIVFILMISSLEATTCGDVNGDDKLNLLDISDIINFLYRDQSTLECGGTYTSICGDYNADGKVNLLDVSRILNKLYFGGPALICTEWGEVTDIDGNVYKTVKIGDQWWMAENLKVTHFQNGDLVPEIVDNNEWYITTIEAYCNYDNNVNNVAIYGRLYNGYAAIDGRNISPDGWHVPSDEEWKELEICLGMTQLAADARGLRGTHQEGGKLKEGDTTYWMSPNIGAADAVGFKAMPGGYRWWSGDFRDMTKDATFWTSTQNYDYNIWYRTLRYDLSQIYRSTMREQGSGSIRCVKDL